ncbi:NAD(P)-dependent alcohol dehydrogenase [Acidisoma cladoniae]|uniref:NAD(P)-dependent alcohol dehydrogenase n=1 Tax=Acidisoma cladoniae TaxID=3040935 RepID=UPI002549E931|nr:NAD(P)-dependent alcohol dehydrogenase [Acidisoma sp. PAMC 29798]
MKAMVLEEIRRAQLRDIAVPTEVGPGDVKIAMKAVGICGSDLHYYLHGKIGPFVVEAPMILGHEGAGEVIAVGSSVTNLKAGDRVCMEPGIPDWTSRASQLGLYNLDPAVRFWATPPVHGCLVPEIVHPANLTFKLPDAVSFQEGAFVEPLAVGMQAVTKARILPGQVAVVIGAGTIGMMVALAALAAGISQVIMTDVQAEKLKIAAGYDGIVPVNVAEASAVARVHEITAGWGADVIFEASGSPRAFNGLFDMLCPGGAVVLVGMPPGPVQFDVVAAQIKEARIETVFRYANVYPRAIALLGSGKVDVKPLISRTYPFAESVEAFEFAAQGSPEIVKVQIVF